jgi:ABC-2 type transport system ATP-binding protein
LATSAITVDGVTKSFGSTLALAGVNLEVREGAIFGLLGPNGAGKTTLVRLLSTLLQPDAGRAQVVGHDVVDEPLAVREALGLTGQYAAVDEILTGRENLEMFGRLFKLSRANASKRAGELLERFDLDYAADRAARTYSGGMRRRLDLASSLVTRPRVLFLDEPTTGLDPRSRNEIWTVVRELQREGTTLLLTTQYLEEADELADRIAVIDHGAVIAEGTGSELKDRVGGQLLEVQLADASEREHARKVLTAIGCGEPEPDERPDRLMLPAPRDGLELIEHAAASLRGAQIRVSDLGLRRPTLDDVFLQLTGASGDRERWAACALHRSADNKASQAAAPAGAPVAEHVAWRRHGRRGGHRAQPPPLHTRTAALDLLDDPARDVRAAVRLRVRRRVESSLPAGVSYVNFLLPGIFVQSVTFRASQTAVGLSQDLERGVIDRFRSMPMARSAVLVGRTLADLVRNVVIILLMTAVGYLSASASPAECGERSAPSQS